MKILQINNKFNGAGAENVMKMLGRGLSERNHEVYYATYENISDESVFKINTLPTKVVSFINLSEHFKQKIPDTEKFHLVDPNDSLIKRIGLNFRGFMPLIDPIAKKSMQSIINNVKPDIIHCHNILPSLAPIVMAKKNNIPVIMTLHGYWLVCPLGNRIKLKSKHICDSTDFEKCNINCASSCVNVEKYMKKMQNIIIDNVDCLVSVSNYVENLLVDYEYPKNKLLTIHNGIDVDKFKANNSSTKPQVIHVGRLSLHKGSHIFLKVANDLSHEYPKIKFILIGSGIKKSIDSCDNIEYIGWISDSQLVKMYSESLCVVIPSQWPEPLGLVTLEAMGCSTPVIGTNLAGIAETIIDNVTGLLIDQSDEDVQVKSISKGIVYFYKNVKIREKMGKSSRKYVVNNFNKKQMVNKYIDIYNKLL